MDRTPDDQAAGLNGDEEVTDLDRDERREVRSARRKQSWWRRRRVGPSDRDEILGQLFYEGERHKPYLYRFSLLQALSVVIAVAGILGGSPAIVIGAMLLAPLMTPVLSLAVALVMVWPRRAGRAGLLVVATSVGSMLLAWAVTSLLPHSQVLLPYELLSRSRPTLLDMVVALAAGAAAGYALVRKELGTALPGVAVAVALVPPLAVVGASLELGRSDLAMGAGLLYLINLAAILLASGVVFLVTGFIPGVRVARLSRQIVVTVALSLICVGALAVPLTRSLQTEVREERERISALEEVASWLGDREIEVAEIVVDGEDVTVDLIGEGPPPSAAQLAGRLEDRLGRPVAVTVRWVERHHDTYPPDGDNGTG